MIEIGPQVRGLRFYGQGQADQQEAGSQHPDGMGAEKMPQTLQIPLKVEQKIGFHKAEKRKIPSLPQKIMINGLKIVMNVLGFFIMKNRPMK